MSGNNVEIAHLNIRSLLPKFNELKHHIIDKNCDSIALTDTWLGKDKTNAHIAITGYNVVQADRYGRGGKVLFYKRDIFQFNI